MTDKVIDHSGAVLDISGLPDELLQELKIQGRSASDTLDAQIMSIIEASEGPVSLDHILVALYRKFGVLKKRRFMQNKLYRMNSVVGLEGRNGLYEIHPALREQAAPPTLAQQEGAKG